MQRIRLADAVRRDLGFDTKPLPDVLVRSLDSLVELSEQPNNASSELQLVTEVDQDVRGFGPLQRLLANPNVEEIWMNDQAQIWWSELGHKFHEPSHLSQTAYENLVARLLRNSSRRVDRMHPFADATLADGSRVHAVIAPVTRSGWSINIRKFPALTRTLDELTERGMLTESQASHLSELVRNGRNLLISGATNTGKTTLLSALIAQLPAAKRVVTVEETHELKLINNDWVALQGRPEGQGDAAAIDLRRLVRESLRMRPDVLVVGEVRGAEALDLVLAMNSGIPAAGTIHAKSAAAALTKLMLLPTLAQANVDQHFMQSTVLSVVDAVAHLENLDGKRRLVELLEVDNNAV